MSREKDSRRANRERMRGMSDSAPLYALIIVAGAIATVALLIGGLWLVLR